MSKTKNNTENKARNNTESKTKYNRLSNNLFMTDHCQLRCFERRIKDKTIVDAVKNGVPHRLKNGQIAYILTTDKSKLKENIAVVLDGDAVVTVFKIDRPLVEWEGLGTIRDFCELI